MAQPATIYNIEIDLANHDRAVYETLALRVAQHPSESPEYLVTRILAYALEYTEGIAFSAGGVSSPDEPAISVRDLTGAIRAWIEIGNPDAARLHRASKAAPRVAVYTYRDVARLAAALAGERIHRREALELYGIERRLVDALVTRLDRRVSFALSVSGGELYISIGSDALSAHVRRERL